jgi:hypothetical protein
MRERPVNRNVASWLAVATLAMLCASACGGHAIVRATSPSPTAKASVLRIASTDYEYASSALDSAATSFGIAARRDIKANNAQSFYGDFVDLWGALTSFDTEVKSITFPSSLTNDVHSVLAADKALEVDLQPTGALSPQAWAAKWNSDIVSAQTAHDALTHALGLPNDTFLTKIGLT